jgi:NADPH:quinone reductase-like Zn-dependent oxidoreductase
MKAWVYERYGGPEVLEWTEVQDPVATRDLVVGPDVTRFAPGDEICAEVDAGGFAELIAVPERFVARKPSNLTFERAAAVPMAALTALQGLRDKGNVAPGQHVLVSGASGGIGSFAVQIAKALGAEVTAVCSAKNLDMVRSIGADHAVDYTQEDVTRGEPRFDVVFDTVGTHSFADFRKVMSRGGAHVAVGRLDGR